MTDSSTRNVRININLVGRLKKFPVKLVPNMRTYIVRLAAMAVSAEHPLSNGKKMEIVKTQTLLKIPSLHPLRFD